MEFCNPGVTGRHVCQRNLERRRIAVQYFNILAGCEKISRGIGARAVPARSAQADTKA